MSKKNWVDTMENRIELCQTCKKCSDERIEQGIEGCACWHNDKHYGGCSEYVEEVNYCDNCKTNEKYCYYCIYGYYGDGTDKCPQYLHGRTLSNMYEPK